MGKRGRRKSGGEPLPSIPDAEYPLEGGGTLSLRCVLGAKSREAYRRTAAGGDSGAAASIDDSWQRATEFLFERLATGWEVSGVRYSGQAELLARFRAAAPDERRAVRGALREHLAEWFPELTAP